MKKYMAKYLPAEGEILPNEIRYSTTDKVYYKAAKVYENDQKVKLYLVSRDIHIGDNVRHLESGENRTVIADTVYENDTQNVGGYRDKGWCLLNIAKDERVHVKVIGEISAEAIWVRESDEFDDNDIQKDLIWTSLPVPEYREIYKILNHSCKHFH